MTMTRAVGPVVIVVGMLLLLAALSTPAASTARGAADIAVEAQSSPDSGTAERLPTTALDESTTNDTASAHLTGDPTMDGLQVSVGPDAGHRVVTRSGREGWQTDRAAGGPHLLVNVSDDYRYGGENTLAVTVTYFDAGDAGFALHYDSTDQTAGSVDGSDSGTWRERTFLIEAARLNNGIWGNYDFRATTWGDDDVVFGDVTVRPLSATVLGVEVRNRAQGNLFRADETPAFDVVTGAERVEWSVRNYEGEEVHTRVRDVSDDGRLRLTVPVEHRGYYDLTVTGVRGGEDVETVQTSFGVLSAFDPPSHNTMFGIWHQYAEGPVPLITTLGATTTTNTHRWRNIEVERGNYSYASASWIQELMVAAEREGLGITMTPHGGNPLYMDTDEPFYAPHTPAHRRAFADFAAAVAATYPDRRNAIEVWNEYSFEGSAGSRGPAGGDPVAYAKTAATACERIEERVPGTTVVADGGNFVQERDPFAFMETVAERAGFECIDGLALHPYRPAMSPEATGSRGVGSFAAEMRKSRRIAARHAGGGQPGVYVTEYGYNTGSDSAHTVSERRQARYLVRSYAMGKAANVTQLSWFQLADGNPGNHPTRSSGGWGLFRLRGANQSGPMAPKPSAVAFAVAARQLTDATFQGREAVQDTHGDGTLEGVYSYVVETPDGTTRRMLWARQPTTATLQTTEALDVTGVMGRRWTERPTDGSVTLRLDGDPVYVDGSIESVAATVPTSALVDVRLSSPNPSEDGLQLPVSLRASGNTSLRATGLTWSVGDGGTDARTVTLDRTMSLDRTAGGWTTESIPVPAEAYPPWRPVGTSLTVDFADRDALTVNRSVGYNPVVRGSHDVDGTLEEVRGRPGIRLPEAGSVHVDDYSGARDTSADVWLDWDDQHLYLSARVTDDVHHQPETGAAVWRGDSIQLGVTTDRPAAATSFSEFSIALTDDGPQVHRVTQPAGDDARAVAEANAAIRRDGASNSTVYEVAIPWSALGASDGPPETTAAALIVNDNDGSGRRGYLAWGADIGATKDPTAFDTVRLVSDSSVTTASGDDATPTARAATEAPGFGPITGVVAVLLGLLVGARGRR
jgi:nitroreductase